MVMHRRDQNCDGIKTLLNIRKVVSGFLFSGVCLFNLPTRTKLTVLPFSLKLNCAGLLWFFVITHCWSYPRIELITERILYSRVSVKESEFCLAMLSTSSIYNIHPSYCFRTFCVDVCLISILRFVFCISLILRIVCTKGHCPFTMQ